MRIIYFLGHNYVEGVGFLFNGMDLLFFNRLFNDYYALGYKCMHQIPGISGIFIPLLHFIELN